MGQGEGKEEERDMGGRDATSMIPRAIIIMRIIHHVCIYLYIYIYSSVYVRVRDQTFALSLK